MMQHHHLTPFWTAVFTIAAVATFTPWGRLRNALRRLRGPRVEQMPDHPAARVLRARRLDLTDEQARIRWQQISEKQLGAQLRTPQSREGGQR